MCTNMVGVAATADDDDGGGVGAPLVLLSNEVVMNRTIFRQSHFIILLTVCVVCVCVCVCVWKTYTSAGTEIAQPTASFVDQINKYFRNPGEHKL